MKNGLSTNRVSEDVCETRVQKSDTRAKKVTLDPKKTDTRAQKVTPVSKKTNDR